jgi:peptidoglycan/LPS O-acetylase OafA/YrhL
MFTQLLTKYDKITIDNKNNAFDFVRLVLAIFVVLTHSRYLFGAQDILHWEAKYFDNLHTGTVALWGFFAVSGFLVTSSYLRSDGIVDFFLKRCKRIFPGFWMSILVCGFLFLPLWYFIKEKSIMNFWTTNGLDWWKFMTSNLDSEIKINSVGKVAIDTINGPWWTIHHELRAYLGLGVFGLLGLLNKNKKWSMLVFAIFLNIVRIMYSFDTGFAKFYSAWFGDERVLLFFAVFMWGVVINLYKDVFVLRWSTVIASFGVLMLGTYFDFLPVVLPFCFTYFVIGLSYGLPIRNISSHIGDLSFGIYLYHWPIRLTLQMLGYQQSLSFWPFVILNFVLTIPFALLSWNFVEKRYLIRHSQKTAPVMKQL